MRWLVGSVCRGEYRVYLLICWGGSLTPCAFHRNMIDVEPFKNGNVWKMFLGSIRKDEFVQSSNVVVPVSAEIAT